MDAFKKLITAKRGISFYFIAASFVCALVTLVLYLTTGITSFTPVLSEKVLALMWINLVLCIAVTVVEIKPVKYAAYIVELWAWLEFIVSEMAYITNVFVSIDGNSFSVTFILTVVFGALSYVFALVSAIVQREELGFAHQTATAAMEGRE